MKQSVFLKCKIMPCSRTMKCSSWSPPPAASAASAAAIPGGCVALAVAAGPRLPAARFKPPLARLQSRFKIITIIVQIIAIMANNSINWARIDTVSALVQSTLASLALLLLAESLRVIVL